MILHTRLLRLGQIIEGVAEPTIASRRGIDVATVAAYGVDILRLRSFWLLAYQYSLAESQQGGEVEPETDLFITAMENWLVGRVVAGWSGEKVPLVEAYISRLRLAPDKVRRTYFDLPTLCTAFRLDGIL